MKSYFYITASVVLGSFLGYGLYSKILNRDKVVIASDISVDPLFLADNIDFEKRKKEAMQLARMKYMDSLQLVIQTIEAESMKQDAIAAVIKPKAVYLKEFKRKIEISEIKTPTIVSVSPVPLAEKIEVATLQITTAGESIIQPTEGAAQSQPQTDKKKKFSIFSKKNKND